MFQNDIFYSFSLCYNFYGDKMKKFLLCLITLLFICGCSNSNLKKNYTFITADEAYEMIKNEDVIIIDVRSKIEFESGHLENAINIPHEYIAGKIGSVADDLNQKIIIYCRSGARAEVASTALVTMGYKNVYTFGGINSWNYNLVK